MKILLGLIVVFVFVVAFGVYYFRTAVAGGIQEPQAAGEGSFWDLQTKALEGQDLALDKWRGQVALVVNVASKCGLTPQYTGLEALYRELSGENDFVIIGFPSNDFMGQEPGTAAEIREFCSSTYDVTFPLTTKVKVKGDEKHPVYDFLTQGGLDEPSWNFTKYLVGRDGKVVARFGPKTAPDDPQMREAIKGALAVAAP